MKKMTKDDLAERFAKLGARDPDAWAASQIDEGINQLGRFIFLRQAWRKIVECGDHAWIDGEVAYARSQPDRSGAGECPDFGVRLE